MAGGASGKSFDHGRRRRLDGWEWWRQEGRRGGVSTMAAGVESAGGSSVPIWSFFFFGPSLSFFFFWFTYLFPLFPLSFLLSSGFYYFLSFFFLLFPLFRFSFLPSFFFLSNIPSDSRLGMRNDGKQIAQSFPIGNILDSGCAWICFKWRESLRDNRLKAFQCLVVNIRNKSSKLLAT